MNKYITTLIVKLLLIWVVSPSSMASTESKNFTPKQLSDVKQIKTQALESELAWQLVESLTTEVGPRMPGTPGDKAGVDWAVKKFKALGFDKVWTEPATFPKWIRYSESAAIISPAPQNIHITALGNSISTPIEGIEAEVIEFANLADLEKAPDDVAQGKIVFINYRMDPFNIVNSLGIYN
jgi:hypothetical protein